MMVDEREVVRVVVDVDVCVQERAADMQVLCERVMMVVVVEVVLVVVMSVVVVSVVVVFALISHSSLCVVIVDVVA